MVDLRMELRDSAEITAITQLILRERESRDLQRWDTMRECFWPDSLVRVSWFQGSGEEFVTGSRHMAKRGVAAKHRLGPVLVTLAGQRAIASLSAIIDLPVKLGPVEATLSAHARFLYRVEKRGQWRIVAFDAYYMRDEVTPAIPGHTISIVPKELEPLRPSYRMLAYCLKSQGFEIDSSLAGEDRPETVEALNREVFGWAGLPVPK